MSALVGLSMLGATIATMSVSKKKQEELKQRFSPEIAEKYTAIVQERTRIYIQGLLLGLLVSFGLLYTKLQHVTTRFHRVCFILAITISVSIVYYLLVPKSAYILTSLKTQEENKAWLEMYNTMKHRYLIGFLLGAFSSFFFANSMC